MEETTIHLTFRVVPEKLSTGKTVYVALCKEIGVASQGDTEQQAKDNVLVAVQLWLETASQPKIAHKINKNNPASINGGVVGLPDAPAKTTSAGPLRRFRLRRSGGSRGPGSGT